MIRTKPCKKCGEVIFNINSTCEQIELICKNCNTVNLIYFEKYSTVDNECRGCSNNSFKIKVDDKNDSENVVFECVNCKSSATKYFVDKDCNEIDRTVREMLIIQDSINSLKAYTNNVEARVNVVEKNVRYIQHDLFEYLSKIVNENKLDINSLNYDLSSYSNEIAGLKDMINNIEKNIISSLYLFK